MIQLNTPPVRGSVAFTRKQQAPTVIRFGNDVKTETPVTPPVKTPAKKSWLKSFIKLFTFGLVGSTAAVAGIQIDNKINQVRTDATAQLATTQEQISKFDAENKALEARLKEMGDLVSSKVSLSDVAKVVADVAPANVMVKGKGGLGSGTWLQDNNGNLFILTNHHVVDDNSIRGEDSPPTFEIRLHNGLDTKEGTKVEGQLIKLANGKYAESAEHDLALIGISTPNFKLPAHIKPMKLRDMKANPLKAGEFVIVVGSPRGLTDNVTHGIISHVDRKLEGFEEANVFVGVDAPINPGNSGGSCYDMQGRYIGPPTAGIRGADGMGFAIRTDIVKQQLSDWGVTLP
jgi:S1-C subfamily serine protease